MHFDDRRTFLTEMINEDEHHDAGEEEVGSTVETVQPNAINQFMNKNYVTERSRDLITTNI